MRFLSIVLVAIVVLRLVVMLFLNGGRVPADKLEGIDINGRYYPVEKVCLTIDDGELEDGLHGTPLDQGIFSLMATGNRFDVDPIDPTVAIGCGWEDWNTETNPRVHFYFAAWIHPDRVDSRPACRATGLTSEADTISLGRFDACRRFDGIEVGVTVIDDNAEIACSVDAADNSMLPALERVMLPQCEDFVEQLSRSRPITYAGGGFFTVR